MKRFTVVLVAGWMLSGGVVPALAIAQDPLPIVTAKQGKNKPKGNDDPIVPVNSRPKAHSYQHQQPKPSDDPIVPIYFKPH